MEYTNIEYADRTCLCQLNDRDELLMRINNVADIIRQIPNLLEKTWSLFHRRMEKCIKVNETRILTLNNCR